MSSSEEEGVRTSMFLEPLFIEVCGTNYPEKGFIGAILNKRKLKESYYIDLYNGAHFKATGP